jgi:hypothetical protein
MAITNRRLSDAPIAARFDHDPAPTPLRESHKGGTSAYGPEPTSCDVRYSVGIRSKADVIRTRQRVRLRTRSGGSLCAPRHAH